MKSLPSNTDFYFFKDYIKPQWEHPKNKKGGRWIYDIGWEYDKHREISSHTENIWLNLVRFIYKILSIIGNHFKECEYFITGVVLSIRHYNNKISIWTTNCDKETILTIGKCFKENCKLDTNEKIHYQMHQTNPKFGYEPLYTL